MESFTLNETIPPIQWQDIIKAAIDKAILEERKRCATIADEHAKSHCDEEMSATDAMRLGAESIGFMIRNP